MRKLQIVVLALCLQISALPVEAHHPFAAEFDANKPVTVQGTLTKLDWINPHSWIYVDVKTPDGTIQHWLFEAGAPNQLMRRGMRKTEHET